MQDFLASHNVDFLDTTSHLHPAIFAFQQCTLVTSTLFCSLFYWYSVILHPCPEIPLSRGYQVSIITSGFCRLCSSDSMLEILNIMGHSSGQITHDVSHYFQSETPDAHARHHLNTTTAFKSLSLEQIMSSDHPPYKRDESLRAAAPKAFPMLVEPTGDNRNGFVHLTHGLLQTSGRPIKRSNLTGTRQETPPMLSSDSPCSLEDLPEDVDLPRAGD